MRRYLSAETAVERFVTRGREYMEHIVSQGSYYVRYIIDAPGHRWGHGLLAPVSPLVTEDDYIYATVEVEE